MKVKKGLNMNKGMSLNLYRFIDIFIFSFIGLIFEYLAYKFLLVYDYPYFSISLTVLMSSLIMMRWNKYSFIYPFTSGIFYVFLNKGNVINYLIYGFGNLFILFNLLLLNKKRKDIKNKALMNSLYITNSFILICFGRSIVSIFYDNNFIDSFVSFLGTESLNYVFTLIILNLIRKIEGLYEDQVEYIKRIKLEVRYGT